MLVCVSVCVSVYVVSEWHVVSLGVCACACEACVIKVFFAWHLSKHLTIVAVAVAVTIVVAVAVVVAIVVIIIK